MEMIIILALLLCCLLLLLWVDKLKDKLLDCELRRLLKDVDASAITTGKMDASAITTGDEK